LAEDFPEEGKDPDELMEKISKAENRDMKFSSGRIFGSMCTEPLRISKEIYSRFIETNLGNPGLYRGTAELEKEVHDAVGSLIHADDAESLSLGGGTEGNIIALWRAREKTGKRKVILPESAHFSFEKACSLLDMKPEYIPLREDQTVDVDVLEKKIDEDTAAVVSIAGTTEHGAVDPIEKIAPLTDDVHFHVDAAFGGFVIPFLRDRYAQLPDLDFQIEGVDSIILDPHKMGISPVPLGLFYSREDEGLTIDSPYLTGDGQKSLRGTRASASIPAFWTTLNHLGKEGYRDIVSRCMENTYYTVSKMKEIGFEPIVEPTLNIASFEHDEPLKIIGEMEERDWNISRTVKPTGLRFVIMPHVRRENIDRVVEELSKWK